MSKRGRVDRERERGKQEGKGVGLFDMVPHFSRLFEFTTER